MSYNSAASEGLIRLFVDSTAETTGNKTVSVVRRRRQVDRVAISMSEVRLVLAPSHDVSVNVEVGEECQHEQHVSGQQVLAPARKVAFDVDAVQRVRQCDEELHLRKYSHSNK